MLLTSCGKSQDGEKKTVQKSEDDFLDKDAKPDERKYLLAAKTFFIALANRKYADAYALLSSHARARMSLDQFKPAQQDSDVQQDQSYAFDNVTAEQFAYLSNTLRRRMAHLARRRCSTCFPRIPTF